MKKIYIIVAIVIIVFVGIVSSRSRGAVSSSGEIRLGSILILSGEGASWGEAARNGIDLAVSELNQKGGVLGKKLIVTHEDDGSEAPRAVSAFNKLTDSGINYVIGTNWSNTGVALTDLAKQKKTVLISPSLGVREFNEANGFIFNTWPHDEILSEQLADLVYAKGHRRVALLGAQQNWVITQTKAFKQRFEKLGGTIEFQFEPTITTTDVRTEMAKIKANKNIDAIVMTIDGYSLTDVTAIQLKQLGVTLPLYSITIDRQIIKNCQGACEGMIFPTFLTPAGDFEARYKTTYNREVEIGSDSAYDAVMMLTKAMEATRSTDTTVVAKYLAGIKEYDGVSGHLVSDGKRAFTKPYKVMRVMNGEPVEIKN